MAPTKKEVPKSGAAVSVKLTILGVSFSAVTANSDLLKAMKDKIASSVKDAMLADIPECFITVELSAGSVIAQLSISLPSDADPIEYKNTIEKIVSTKSFRESFEQSIGGIDGIGKATTGILSVSEKISVKAVVPAWMQKYITKSSKDDKDDETKKPTKKPSKEPTGKPTIAPTELPTLSPSIYPTSLPTGMPTECPSCVPTKAPTEKPTEADDAPCPEDTQ
jgi:hypothetical protein